MFTQKEKTILTKALSDPSAFKLGPCEQFTLKEKSTPNSETTQTEALPGPISPKELYKITFGPSQLNVINFHTIARKLVALFYEEDFIYFKYGITEQEYFFSITQKQHELILKELTKVQAIEYKRPVHQSPFTYGLGIGLQKLPLTRAATNILLPELKKTTPGLHKK